MLFAFCLLLIESIQPSPAAVSTLEIPVIGSADDAEEKVNTINAGSMVLTSADLEMSWDKSTLQQFGLRFQNVSIPANATITNAYIQFTVDRADTGGLVSLTVKGEKALSPAAFSSAKYNISGRTRTAAGATWVPPGWTVANAAGADQRTPNLSSILQEIMRQPGWASGNPVAFLIQDNGSGSKMFRAAQTVDGTLGLAGAPLLHVEFTAQTGVAGAFQQDAGGLVSIEAEHHHASSVSPDGHAWLSAGGSFPGYSGMDALQSLPEDRVTIETNLANQSPRLDYRVNFATTGTHYVWVRAQGPLSSSNSLHLGVDQQEVPGATNIRTAVGAYKWVGTVDNGSRATLDIGTAGLHAVNVWMRESGTLIDKLVITRDAAYKPATVNGGMGPDESPELAMTTVAAPAISPNGGVFTAPVSVSLSTGTAGAAIRYTVDGSDPTSASAPYTGPFQVTVDTTVKARAFLAGYSDSPVSVALFDIQLQLLPAGLTQSWQLDETRGSSYGNLVNGNPSASCSACPTPVAGRVGGAQAFDGNSDELNVPDDSSFDWSRSARFSIEAWIRRNSPCSITGETVIGRRDASSLLEWSLGCQGSNATFRLIDTTGSGRDLVGTTDIADGEWHHLLAARDAISGKNVLYVDGVQEASASVSYAGGFAGVTGLNIGWLNQGGADYHFAGVIDEVALHNRMLPDSEIRRHYADGALGLQRGYWGCGAPVRIMPLGDSITRRSNPGYRQGLYSSLIGAGMDVDMVGSVLDSCVPNCSYDPDNEGHSGYTPTDIAGNVSTWLSLNPPDVVTLHIGTNVDASFPYPDVTQLGVILDAIKAYDADIPVVLARIINKARTSYDPQLSVFNQNLQAMAQARVAAGDRILVVNQEPGLDYSASTADFPVADNLHPNASGSAKMVPVWFEGLNRFMPACNSVAPRVISQHVTRASRGVPYVYVVEATGVPAPAFRLSAAPAGMTIHPDTGRIQWTPSSVGTYQVTVQLSNSVGSSTQNVTITVN